MENKQNNQSALIFKKIPAIMGKVGAVKKNKKNIQQGYQFRGIDDMYNALNKHLSDEGVFVVSDTLLKEREERKSKNGGALIYTILTIKFRFYAEDGSSIESTAVGEAMDSGDKSCNKAMSTAYKYALMQIFCIPTEEEKDTENNSYEVKAHKCLEHLGQEKTHEKFGEYKVCQICGKKVGAEVYAPTKTEGEQAKLVNVRPEINF